MGPNCPPSCQMAPTQVMPHGQKSKSCKLKEDLQAPREAQGLVGMQAPIAEEDEATPTSSSSSLFFDPGLSRGGACHWDTESSSEFPENLLLLHCHHSHSFEQIK